MSSCIVFPSKDCVAKTALNFTASKFNYQPTKRSWKLFNLTKEPARITILILMKALDILEKADSRITVCPLKSVGRMISRYDFALASTSLKNGA